MNRFMRRAVLQFSRWNRARKAAVIQDFMERADVRTVVFVGCSPAKNANEAIVERAVAERAEVLVACDVLPCEGLPWPFRQMDGRHMDLPDDYADMVLANAVIEHVGDLADQVQFVKEQSRVGRSWVITTPNRWFPVESHTSAILKHWSRGWRRDRHEFTRLLSRSEFRDLLPADAVLVGRPWSATFTATWTAAPERVAG